MKKPTKYKYTIQLDNLGDLDDINFKIKTACVKDTMKYRHALDEEGIKYIVVNDTTTGFSPKEMTNEKWDFADSIDHSEFHKELKEIGVTINKTES